MTPAATWKGISTRSLSPNQLSKTKPSRVTLTFSARVATTDGAPPPAVTKVAFETDKHLSLHLERMPQCSLSQLHNLYGDAAHDACQSALIGSGQASVQSQSQPTARKPIDSGPQLLVFNGGTKNEVTTLLVHLSVPEPVMTSVVFPVRIRQIKQGRFGLSWKARVPRIASGAIALTSVGLKLQKGLYATCPDGHLFARGAAEFADGNKLSFRLPRDRRGCQPQPGLPGAISNSRCRTSNPSPAPLRRRSRRLRRDESPSACASPTRSRPTTAPILRRQRRSGSSSIGSCTSISPAFRGAHGCRLRAIPDSTGGAAEPAIVAGGRIKWEIALPEQEAFRTGAEATVYRGSRNKLLIRTYVPAPIDGEVVIPVALSPVSEGRYGLGATATIPKLAGGSGSLTYLGLRFRKGLFSAACPKRRLQSHVIDIFADGTEADGGLIVTC